MSLPAATALHTERLARLKRVTGWVTLLVALPLATLDGNGWLGSTAPVDPALDGVPALLVPFVPGPFGTLALLVAFALWRMLAWRIAELARLADAPATPRRGVPFFALRFVPTALLVVVGVQVLFGVDIARWLGQLFELEPLVGGRPLWAAALAVDVDSVAALEASTRPWIGGVNALLAVACALVALFFAAVDPTAAPEAKGFAAWARVGTWYCGLVAAVLLAPTLLGADVAASVDLDWIPSALGGLATLLWIEVALRSLATFWARIYDGTAHPGARVLTDAVVPRLLGSSFNPVKSLFDVAADGFGIDIRGTYALVYMRRALLPIGALLALVAWVASAFHVVPTRAVGVLERFGARPDGVLEPGLHVLFPWPIDRVHTVDVGQVRSMPVGYERAIEGAPMLWTETHAQGEYRLVLGDGEELLSINAVLHWRPSDPLAFVYTEADPEAALSAICSRALFEQTVDRDLDDVLAGNLEQLTSDFETAIATGVAERGLGIEIVDLVVLSLHPPREVAADYQSVVSNQIEGERLVIEAESTATVDLLEAQADAFAMVSEARAAKVQRVASEVGEMEAFRLVAGARSGDPDTDAALELVLYLDRLERALAGTPYSVWDARLDADGATWWILDR
jgi:regulator of protease activity HflC (stomatin/prohibitin superfamily)